MNPYNFSLLFLAFCSFFIALLIWLRRRDRVGRIYFIFSTFVAIWGASFSFTISDNASYQAALFSSRLAHGAAGLVGITWYHFCLVFTDQFEKHKKIIVGSYIFALIILSFAFTPWFIPRVAPAVGFKHYTQDGFLLNVYMLYFFVNVILGFVTLHQEIKRSDGDRKLQLQGLFFSTLIGFIFGTAIILPIYEIMLPQYNLFITSLYPFMMAYFMMRHHLFDLEQAVQAFQREKLATIGLLAASVNHEIRNPLYAAREMLGSYIEILKEGKQNKGPLQTSEKIKCQIDRALEVITKLNRFAKPISDSISLDSRASIPEAIQNVLDLVSYESSLDRIKIDNQINLNISQIQADQRQLEEILFNLIVNACHAMDQGGTLIISASCHSEAEGRRISEPRSFTSFRMTGKVQITIQDTGTGIFQDQMKHLFEPFHTTKGDKGTGLGLYITKQLVERNGGKITVQSKEGKGTAFLLEFKAV